MGTDITLPIEDGFVNVRVGAIIEKDGRLLMVRNADLNYCYSVGGRVQFGESAEEAVRREVREETGWDLEIEQLGFVHEDFFWGDSPSRLGKLIYEIGFYVGWTEYDYDIDVDTGEILKFSIEADD